MLTSHAVQKHDEERRSCRRATLQWVVLVYFGGDQWGKLIDLSEKGMRFQFEHPPALRQSINFTFEAMGCMAIPSEGKVFGDSIQATGRVKWTREFERTAGVEFIELSQRSRDQIRYWISSGALLEEPAPSQELHHEWNKKRSKKADQKTTALPSASLASAPHPAELAPSQAKPLLEPRREVFESDPTESDVEVVWEPEPSPQPPTIDESSTRRKRWPVGPNREAALPPAVPEEPRKKRPAEVAHESAFASTAPTVDEPATHRKKWSVEARREAPLTPVLPEEPATPLRKRPADAEPESPFASPTLDEPPAHRRKWGFDSKPEPAFAEPALDEPVAPHWAREPEPEHSYLPTLDEAAAAELREKLDALSHRQRPAEPEAEDSVALPSFDEPAPAPEEFDPVPAERQGFWESQAGLTSQGVGFDVPGMLHHDERQRRGQTLELKQRRARVGFIAVLGFLATAGALVGIIRFTSTFNERAEATEVSRPSEGRAASSRADSGAAAEATSTFLVEVLDASNRRSVLLFSGPTRTNKSGRGGQEPSQPETSVMAVQEPREEFKTPASKKEASRDFTLIAPRAAASIANTNSSVEAPALSTQAPASLDAPLQNLPSPARPAADRTTPVGGDVQPARLVHAVLPSYPQMARTNRVAGDVTLDALVDETGTVKDVQVLAGPLLLREAAKEALRQWRYEPARLDGQPAAMHLTVTVKFQNNQENR